MKEQKKFTNKGMDLEPFKANEVPDFKTLHKINEDQLKK